MFCLFMVQGFLQSTWEFALAAFGSAYFAEIIRAGIDAVPKGQLESKSNRYDWLAGYEKYYFTSNNFNYFAATYKPNTDTYKRISCFINYYSPWTDYDRTMVQGDFRPFEAFIMVALLYWALNETIATICKLEKKFQN